MTSRLVWAAGIAGFLAYGLSAGAALPGLMLPFVLLIPLLLIGPALGLIIGMRPRRFSPDTLKGRSQLYGAFLGASLVGALIGIFLPLGIAVWLPFGLIALGLLGFTFKVGSYPRPTDSSAE
jgi:hypothetical protein